MSYAGNIVLTEQPLSAELYELIEANSDHAYYTSYMNPITFMGNTYIPLSIKRSAFSVDSSIKTVDVRIAAPMNEAFGIFLAMAPYKSSYINLTKVFLDNPDSNNQLLFAGLIHTVTLKDGIATALCKSHNNRLSQKLPRGYYQTNCNHVFLDDGCKLTSANYTAAVTVTAVDYDEITIGELTSIPSGTFQGGSLLYGNDERLITSQIAGVCRILIPFTEELNVGETISIRPGCDGSCGICKGYGNLEHFFGFPYIPTKNAVIWGFK